MSEYRANAMRALALGAALLISTLLAATGCKDAAKLFTPKEKPAVKRPAPWYEKPFVAYCRQGADNASFEIWRTSIDGADRAMLTSIKNPRGYSLKDLGPTVSIMAWDPERLRLFYTYDKKLFRFDIKLKTNELIAEMISLPNKGIDWMWFSSDYSKMLAHVSGAPSPDMYRKEEYIQVDLTSGAQKKVSPADETWDQYSFFNNVDFFIIEHEKDGGTYPAPQGGAYFSFEPGKGSGGWPMLQVSGADGSHKTVTDGAQRVLAARWAPSAKALAFVPGESCEAFCRGRIHTADPDTGAATPISTAMFRFDILMNMVPDQDAIVYYEPDQGVMRYNFDNAPSSALDADGANPFLFVPRK